MVFELRGILVDLSDFTVNRLIPQLLAVSIVIAVTFLLAKRSNTKRQRTRVNQPSPLLVWRTMCFGDFGLRIALQLRGSYHR